MRRENIEPVTECGIDGLFAAGLVPRRGWDRALAELARAQHGVVSRAQMEAIGLTRSAIEHRVRRGRLHRVYPGVYAVGHRRLTPRSWWMAAVLSGGRGAVLAGGAAAALRGLADGSPGVAEVLVLRTGVRHRGVRQRRVRLLAPEDRSVVDGIPCTSLARTFLDMARGGDERAVDRAIRRSVERQEFDLEAVTAVLERGAPGTVVLRRALAAVADDERDGVVTKDELERRFRELLVRHGFPLPSTNVVVATRTRDWEVDALWRARRLVVELDGWWTHCDRESFRRDHQRGVDVRAEGFEVVRLSWDQVVGDEEGTVALLRVLLHHPR